jgi:ubiquinone/menaquinone biosynthesis C-methylase UbiE
MRETQKLNKMGKRTYCKSKFKRVEDILDLGCGDGKVTAEIARLVGDGSVVGVDNSRQMIDLAKEKYSQNKHPNLSFQVMDASDLLFEECYDVVSQMRCYIG